MINQTTLHQQINDIVTSAKKYNIFDTGLPQSEFIKQFRTINLRLPRRSGKSSFLKYLADNYSCITFFKYGIGKLHLENFNSDRKYTGIRNILGLKYRYILLDEYNEIPDEIFKIIDTLLLANLLEKDFFIIGLHT